MKKPTLFSKCAGCKALNDLKTSYSCSLGLAVKFNKVGEVATSPVPTVACLKPTTSKELKKLMDKK